VVNVGIHIASGPQTDMKTRIRIIKLTDRRSNSCFHIVLFVATFLLVCGGLRPAFANMLPQQAEFHPIVRVDSCHQIIHQVNSTPCCQSLACHQPVPIQRDLGRPEFQTRHKETHPLLQESRPLTPQLKVGEIFHNPFNPPTNTHFRRYQPYKPLQSLISLRSVILLH